MSNLSIGPLAHDPIVTERNEPSAAPEQETPESTTETAQANSSTARLEASLWPSGQL